jgi:hypothetical protein
MNSKFRVKEIAIPPSGIQSLDFDEWLSMPHLKHQDKGK